MNRKARLGLFREVRYENVVCGVSSGALPADFRLAMMVARDALDPVQMLMGPMGILGPVLLIFVGLWLGRGDRSPWYVKAVLLGLLAVLFLIMFGYV